MVENNTFPIPSDPPLYLMKLLSSSYPEGKLWREPATRWFHWSFATLPQPPSEFSLTLPCSSIFHGFIRVLTQNALTQTTRKITVDCRCVCACLYVCVWKNTENPKEKLQHVFSLQLDILSQNQVHTTSRSWLRTKKL